jgi:hypothetical protein
MVADSDGAMSLSVQDPPLIPGRKYRLIIATSLAHRNYESARSFHLHWDVPSRISLLTLPLDHNTRILTFNPLNDPIVGVPFRLLSYCSTPLPNPGLQTDADAEMLPLRLDALSELPRLSSPFVGSVARGELLLCKRILREEVSVGEPYLIVCQARAGAGKPA